MEFKLSHDVHQASVQEAKSYTCSFCKRGFSSAQALGGHMNIHRKDRARLNESSKENASLELGETIKVDANSICNQKVHKIYSFVETSSSQEFGGSIKHFDGDKEENKNGMCALLNTDLDLELRLGLEYR